MSNRNQTVLTRAQTPLSITDEVVAACRKLIDEPQLEYIPIKPLPNMTAQNCFENVQQVINDHGGNAVYGWDVYIHPRLMIELEFHCVWQDNDGKLHDVSPRSQNTPASLFLHDKTMGKSDIPTANRMYPITSDPLLIRFVKASKRNADLVLKIYRESKHLGPNITPDPETQKKLKSFQRLKKEAYAKLVVLGTDPCPCSSHKQTSDCCNITAVP